MDNETLPLALHTKAEIAIGVADALTFLHAQSPRIVFGELLRVGGCSGVA